MSENCNDYEDEESNRCDECDGDGEILVCIDDICHGLGYCIHGDGHGYAVCPCCKGSGELPASRRPQRLG